MADAKTTRVCSVDGCESKHYGRGYCNKHHRRWIRHGDPLGGGTYHGELPQFLRDIVTGPKREECIIWPFNRDRNGYGIIHYEGRNTGAHRVVLLLMSSPVRPDLHAAHSCGKGHLGCVNVAHLRWATRQENNDDRIKHGTSSKGEANGTSKLTETQVYEVRASNDNVYSAAERYGVAIATISRIRNRKRWAWLPEQEASDEESTKTHEGTG